MIVVLEGPDFAGKSTLAERMIAGTRGQVIANGPPPSNIDLADHYVRQISDASAVSVLTVFDRLHVGELVYGPILRGQTRLSADEVAEIEQALDSAAALKVHVDAPDAVLIERFRGPRGDDLIGDESNYWQSLFVIASFFRKDPSSFPGGNVSVSVRSSVAFVGRRELPPPRGATSALLRLSSVGAAEAALRTRLDRRASLRRT